MEKDKLIEQIKDNRFGDIDLQTELCDRLYEMAKEESNPNLMGAALFYKGETLFAKDQDIAKKNVKDSLEYLDRKESSELVARADNILGIIASNKEDFSSALNYYLSCLKVCDEYGYTYVKGMASCNIAVLFQMLQSYGVAVRYFEQAIELFLSLGENETSNAFSASIHANIFECCYRLKDVQGMGDALKKIKEKKDFIEPVFLINLYDAIYNTVSGEKKSIESQINKAVEESLAEEEVLDNLDNYQLLCEFLVENGAMDLLGRVLDLIELKVSDNLLTRMQMNFVKYRMLYYKEKGNMAGFMEKSLEYVALYEKVTSVYHESIRESLDLRLYIEELKEKEDSYKKDAVTDNLTKLFNRNGLEKEVRSLFNKAKTKSSQVASFIIDIDYFKQYNDHYGHVMGDECIKKIAKVIRDAGGKRCISARFGGDEFVMIGVDISEKEVAEMASAIIENVAALKLESVDSPVSDYVSVSIGAYWGDFSPEDTLKTLIDKADKGLYKAKENGRNNYCIVRQSSEIE